MPSLEEAFRNAHTDEDNIPVSRQIEDELPVVDLTEVFKNKLQQAALKAGKIPSSPKAIALR